MRMIYLSGIILILGMWLNASHASAMEFRRLPLDDGRVIIVAFGPIADGDDRRLHEFAATLPAGDKLLGIALSSIGGSIAEAEKIADTIRNTKLGTMVAQNQVCASACFLLFAAGSPRVVVEGARIGVHSASSGGAEGLDALAATTLMARDAAALQVPAMIIGRMVTTPPGDIAWLTPSELGAMGVVMVAAVSPSGYEAGAPLRPGTRPTAPISPPTAEVSQGTSAAETVNPAFSQGLAERRAYEAWIGTLNDDERQGALFWAENRSRASRGQYVGCSSPSIPWSEGCRQAQTRLDAADRHRRTEPDYRAGWNSY